MHPFRNSRAAMRGRIARKFGLVSLGFAAAMAALLMLAGPAGASGPTTPPFTECPHIGHDASCRILIVINANGSPTIVTDPSQGPYDGVEDTLIGVLNNSGQTISSLPISGSGSPAPFLFDGDGICDPNNYNVSFSPGANCSGNSYAGQTGYEGPDTHFTSINLAGTSGTVNFNNGGLAAGASTYFSLEGSVNASSLVVDPLIQVSSVAVSATEGTSFNGAVATFFDADTNALPSEYSASIDWGNGDSSTGVITGGNGNFTVSGTTTYLEEGSYPVSVTVTDIDNTSNSQTVSSTATVADAALSGTSSALTATEGAPLSSVIATFTDADPNGTTTDYSATIDWGDGSTSTGVVGGSGAFTVSGSHTYAEEGSYTPTVTIDDAGGSSAVVTGSVSVADAPLSASGVTINSTNPVNAIVANFTDADPSGTTTDYTSTINWGDGSTSTGVVGGSGTFTVSGSHTYAALGPYTVTVQICDVGGSCATATSSVLTYAYPAGGTFVIGQDSAIGTSATFWSSDWTKDNTLDSGANAFKGFETSMQAPVCGTTWTSGTGNSVNPPDTIPAYMAVIVSSGVTQDGSTVSGDIQKVVIVQTDPAGYQSDPGHSGTGTVVATLCG